MFNREELPETVGLYETESANYKLSTRLEPVTKTHSIVDGLQARVKDPLWLLGRQWQVGEFKAHNGGHLVRTELNFSSQAVNNIEWKQDGNDPIISETFDLSVPLEMKVESEKQSQAGTFSAQGWNPKRLEYSFSLKNNDTELFADEYYGNNLDWYNFDLLNIGEFPESTESKYIASKPAPLTFRGMPLPRWWSLEDNQVDLGKIKRPHLNFLTMLLLEFAFIYSQDWYVIPIEHPVGHIRRIDKFVAIDSFGVVSHVKPVIDKTADKHDWEVFTLSPKKEGEFADGRLFYLPNTLYHALEGDPVEKVNFFRDEMANLVWAVEERYENEAGYVINRNDEEVDNIPEPIKPFRYWDTQEQMLVERSVIQQKEGEPGNRYIGPVAIYQPMTRIPTHWIPYKPSQLDTEENYILRRARTVEDRSQIPQYKGVFLSESKYVFEDGVPRVGIMLCRVFQMARDSQGNRYLWRSRKKKPDKLHKSSGLRFDSLIEG
jgi:hypothetical protein